MGERKALVPIGAGRRRTGKETSEICRDRRGLQLSAEQLEVAASPGQDPEFIEGQKRRAPPVELLIAFTRALIRQNPSEDGLYLAIAAAQKEVKVTDGELAVFIDAVYGEKKGSPWPGGFF